MRSRIALFTLAALVALALAVSTSEDTESAAGTPVTSSSGQLTELEHSEPGPTAKQKSSSTASADRPGPEAVPMPSPSFSTVTLPVPSITEEVSLATRDPGYRRSGDRRRGHRGRRGSWRPPPRPPHGRRGMWRRNRYSVFGSWHFLIFGGPVVYCPAPRSASVVRLPRRSGVYVRQSGDDVIGREFATAVRERVHELGIKVVRSDDKAAIELYIVSMEQDPEDPGWGSAVSVSYLSHPGGHFITSQLLDVGDEQVGELAELVAEYVDELYDDYCP
ncbi:MAG: hypothetical protein JSU73_09050 [candidate division WOR-3 bacterium]|nr:MAG: hypothetical protein JSU73_09050 [candidate division WOR-3 bacterium]